MFVDMELGRLPPAVILNAYKIYLPEIFKSTRLISEQTASEIIQAELSLLKAAFHRVRKKRKSSTCLPEK